jgi:hypothetical protein
VSHWKAWRVRGYSTDLFDAGGRNGLVGVPPTAGSWSGPEQRSRVAHRPGMI